jgi:hypothetical protein
MGQLSLAAIIGTVLSFFWRVSRILWVCRVPAVSAIGGGLLLWQVEQARDLFADTGLSVLKWIGFFALLFVWAWLVHATARRALQIDDWVPEAHRPGGLSNDDRVRLRGEFLYYAIWIPRLLGLLVFVFVALALRDTRANLMPAAGLEQADLALSRLSMQLWFTLAVAVIYAFGVIFRQRVRTRLTGSADGPLLTGAWSVFVLNKTWDNRREILASRVNRVLIVMACVITAVFVVALIWPVFLTDWVPRAVFLPVLLGGGLLLFGEIAALSHRYTTPLLLCFFVLGGVMNYLLPHYNDVQWVASAPRSTETHHQTTIADAIKRWKVDNGCPDEGCKVRPIVVAAAGGASRAGFFTATIVGALMDAARQADATKGPNDIRNQIFALSTVSGSSVGAVMMRAAWMDAIERGRADTPPCRDENVTAWFGNDKASSSPKKAATGSWRDCFQQLMVGDFLSPVFVGIAFRDIFPIGNVFTGTNWSVDRAGLLEQSFERWYAQVVGEPVSDCNGSEKGKDDTGLCRRVGHLWTDLILKSDWVPLLFINGTSVSTGRRILVSDVRIDCLQDPDKGFLEISYDYTELRTASRQTEGCANVDHGADDTLDLRLSSTALMSARFPIISPQGVIRHNDKSGEIVDSVVDGGYFENDGLATAADIVRELKSARLNPIVIQIGNDPVDLALPIPGHGVDARPPIATSQERTLFDEYTSIGRALYATRSGHEDGHLDYLRQTLGSEPIRIGLHEITVPAPNSLSQPQPLCRSPVGQRTSMKTVSMSWWLSQPVQAYLDAQLCTGQADLLTAVLAGQVK